MSTLLFSENYNPGVRDWGIKRSVPKIRVAIGPVAEFVREVAQKDEEVLNQIKDYDFDLGNDWGMGASFYAGDEDENFANIKDVSHLYESKDDFKQNALYFFAFDDEKTISLSKCNDREFSLYLFSEEDKGQYLPEFLEDSSLDSSSCDREMKKKAQEARDESEHILWDINTQSDGYEECVSDCEVAKAEKFREAILEAYDKKRYSDVLQLANKAGAFINKINTRRDLVEKEYKVCPVCGGGLYLDSVHNCSRALGTWAERQTTGVVLKTSCVGAQVLISLEGIKRHEKWCLQLKFDPKVKVEIRSLEEVETRTFYKK